MELELITHTPEKKFPKNKHILFVHGSWHGAWCWNEYFLPYFAQNGYVAHALSLQKHGKSKGIKKLRWTSIKDYVMDVEKIVNRLPKTPILVGHSMGGLIVQKYLETHQVPAAILLAPVPVNGVWKRTLQVLLQYPLLFLKANLTFSLYPLVYKPELTKESFFSKNISEDKLKLYFSHIQDESYRAFLDMLLLNLPRPKKIKTKMLVLGAENDTIFRAKDIKKTAKAYNTQAEFFPGMAHDMMLEANWKDVADRIIRWLEHNGL